MGFWAATDGLLHLLLIVLHYHSIVLTILRSIWLSASYSNKDELTLVFPLLLTLTLLASGITSTIITIENECNFTIWPAAISASGTAAISPSGFVLHTGESRAIKAPTSWTGRFWGRTDCNLHSTGTFSCVTGGCRSGKVECDGKGPFTPPTTLVEFTLNGPENMDFYDVSLVDGYNLPVMVVPGGPSGTNCTSTGCVVDVNGECPSELMSYSDNEQVNVVGCKSACVVFNTFQYCSTGNYSSPETCKPTSYSQIFKAACPRAYSYPYDDATSTFTCSSADYTVTFCPVSNSRQKQLQPGSSSLLVTNSILVQNGSV